MPVFCYKDMKFLLGKKIGMSQIFKEDGTVIPVTLVLAGPCKVLNVFSLQNKKRVQIGFEEIKKKGKIDFRYKREFEPDIDYKIGDVIDVSVFKKGEKVKVTGLTKGKGFQGVVKRWGFSGRNKSHGVKHEERTIGSVGSAWPQRVVKGKKMPGRMGSNRKTIKNLQVVDIDKENNLILIKGSLPGANGSLVEIKKD